MCASAALRNHPHCWCVADLLSAPAEDRASAAFAASAAEGGPLLAVQRRGAHAPHVRLRSARTLARVRLVRHRPQRARQQRPGYLGHR